MDKRITKLVEQMMDYKTQQSREMLEKFMEFTKEFTKEQWDELWQMISKIENVRAKLLVGMNCLTHNANSQLYEEYLTVILETDCLEWNEKYYLLGQVAGRIFSLSDIENFKITKLMYQIYSGISDDFSKNFEYLSPIKERNEDLVFVTVQQFLSLMHAPTKTTLDRARVLCEKMGKRVMIVNTAESGGGKEVELLYRLTSNYNPNLLEHDKVEYQGRAYPYFQFEKNMPNIEDAWQFLEFVKKYKPNYIVNIGGDSLLLDACNKLVPVLNVNTVPSRVAKTDAFMQAMGKDVAKEEEELLEILGKSKDDVLRSRFTWSLKEQNHQYTKTELGIPEERFVMVLVGNRLTSEVTNEFIDMIDEILEAGAYLVIMGKMDNYDKICQEDELFKHNTKNLGVQEDVLAVLEHCSLYVNPNRNGGGTSVIEAMYKGCPAVTLGHGDVAVGAGEEFWVEDYEAMKEQIRKYMHDEMFYREMSEKAKKRAEYMLDSDSAFVECIREFEEKIKMYY